jgi:ABC-type antimicrobial peptide transport system permease subunit
MELFQTRLFFRIVFKSREVYFLKIITLAIAFSCSILILLFSLSEFGYDRFHEDYKSIFRILQRNNNESYTGNRLSNGIPKDVFAFLKSKEKDLMILSRLKIMKELSIKVGGKTFHDSKFYAADSQIVKIFSFDVLHGTLQDFQRNDRMVILSSSSAVKYFGTTQAIGKKLKINALSDTLVFSVVAVYKDFPQNSHEEFSSFIRFDSLSLRSLNFDLNATGIYGKILRGQLGSLATLLNNAPRSNESIYKFQSISEIYFGPRVLGEDAKHGDRYSIIILISITSLCLFLALSSFINLTTLSLPYRSRELAVKKLAGTNQLNLMLRFAKESFLVVGSSLFLGLLLLIAISNWIESILSLSLLSLLVQDSSLSIGILTAVVLITGICPLFIANRFAKATPNRLLSTDTISFPRFKRTITFLQLGISIFLIVSSLVLRRQVTYSLVKEPGRNFEQIVYINYPKDLTDEDIKSLRVNWKKTHANIVDILGTSHLPNQITSKELNSEFYSVGVDPAFRDFFGLQILEGNWFKANAGDSIVVVNELARKILGNNTHNVIGVFKDLSEQFNQPEKPLKITIAPYYDYNFLCVKILEVDIRRTMNFLSRHFEEGKRKPSISFLDKRFEEWLRYQDRLNTLSEILAIVSGLLSCAAIYGLSISIVRDKSKQIAIHKLCGASTFNITRLLVREFTNQMLKAMLIFGPLTYITLKELLRTFVYATPFNWLDPLIPLVYCVTTIILLCIFQSLSLNRDDLTLALKK